MSTRRRGSNQLGKKLPCLSYSYGEALRLWDGQGEVAHLAGEQPLAVAIAVGGALIRAAPMELGTGQGRNLNLQQPWKPRRTISGNRAPAVVPSMS